MTGGVLSVAIAGAGYFAALHREGWVRIPRAQVVAVCDRDIEKARATGFPAFASVAAMFQAVVPDILDIALPPAAHAEAIRTGIAAGVPTIVCQKPFCLGLAEAQAMTALAADAGTRLVVHENFRFQPWYRAIRAALDAGRIGRVLQATFRFRPGDGQGRDAYLARQPYFREMPRFLIHETGVHWIDVFRFLFGAPEAVYADLRRLNPAIAGEDAGIAVFDHPGGVRSVFDGNRLIDHAADNTRRTMGEMMVEGTNGVLSLDGTGSVRLRRFGEEASEVLLGADPFDGFGGDCVRALQSHVVSGILDGTPFENAAADYLDVIRVEDALYASAREGRKIPLDIRE